MKTKQLILSALLGILLLPGCKHDPSAEGSSDGTPHALGQAEPGNVAVAVVQVMRSNDSDANALIQETKEGLESIGHKVVSAAEESVEIERLDQSMFIAVRVTANNPVEAADLANRIARLYVHDNEDARIIEEATPPTSPTQRTDDAN